jgi:hypothetical protein
LGEAVVEVVVVAVEWRWRRVPDMQYQISDLMGRMAKSN